MRTSNGSTIILSGGDSEKEREVKEASMVGWVDHGEEKAVSTPECKYVRNSAFTGQRGSGHGKGRLVDLI